MSPIIMLTARDDTSDKIVGLELGADDYVVKPFDPKELVSRVKAVLRRYRAGTQPAEPWGSRRSIHGCGKAVGTTRRPGCRPDGHGVRPAQGLMESPGRVFSRMQLLDRVQGEAYEGYERTIDSHVKNLRKKIEPDPEHPRYVITVYGVGYKLGEGRRCVA